jgi:hypothetical protein
MNCCCYIVCSDLSTAGFFLIRNCMLCKYNGMTQETSIRIIIFNSEDSKLATLFICIAVTHRKRSHQVTEFYIKRVQLNVLKHIDHFSIFATASMSQESSS